MEEADVRIVPAPEPVLELEVRRSRRPAIEAALAQARIPYFVS